MKAPKHIELNSVYEIPINELEAHCKEFEVYLTYLSESSSLSIDKSKIGVKSKLYKELIYFDIIRETLENRIDDPDYIGEGEYESDYDELLDYLKDIQEFQFEIQDLTRHIQKINDELSELDEFEGDEERERLKSLEILKEKFYGYLQDTIKKVWDMDIDINMKKVTINLFGLGKHLM